MQKLFAACMLSFFIFYGATITHAQRPGNDWRVSSKTRTVNNGQSFLFEYSYSPDGRIQTVKYYSATGVLSITISDFKFDRNGKPSGYLVTWNRERASAQVTLGYDGERRLSRLEKLQDNGDKTIFTYSYSRNTITVTEKIPESQKGGNSSMSFYNDNGDYTVTTGDAASRSITSIITLKQNPVASPESDPERFFGGYDAPAFLGVNANGTDPAIAISKNENGLIASRSITKQSGVVNTTYNYINIKRQTPVDNSPGTIIQTNINCERGKLVVERLLASQDGVNSAIVDIRTGKLKLDYSSDGTPYTEIINLINEAGFDADKVKSKKISKNPCVETNEPEPGNLQMARNIFDARKGFAKAPIKFVPFVVTPDAAKKGFKLDSVYTWKAPDDKIKSATGAQILQQVNDMEKELSLRGRTLRKRNAFSDLTYKLIDPKALIKIPPSVTKVSKMGKLNNNGALNFDKLPVIKTKRNKLKDISGLLSTTISGDVGIYFGNVTANSGEFQGMISNTGMVDNSKCTKQCPIDLTISMDAKAIQSLNIGNCVLEISDNPNRKPNDEEVPLATANFNFKTPARTKKGTENMMVNGDVPPSFHTLYYFPVKLNDLSKLAKAEIKAKEYYAYVKFYNDKGQLLFYGSYNTALLYNQINIPIFISQNKEVEARFDDAFTDPTGLFGMYYKSDNLQAIYSTKRDDATLVISERTKVSGDVEIGAQYYNFWYLLDNDLPKYQRKSFIAANFSSEYVNKYRADIPGIRIPGKKSNDMNNYPGYEMGYSLYNGESSTSYNKSSHYTETKSVAYSIFDERFFIGPVPCRITVGITGNASLTRNAVMDTLTNGKVSISTSVTPHLDLTLTGSGGVDAGIAYAKVVANVKIIEVDLPITARASQDADLDAQLKISALSGDIYFTAGICIPIPWFDDICTSFRVDIFDWQGPSKTYPLVK